MGCFVLVHGAFHGGWCWRRVASILRAHEHEVHCPTLTGCGERVHLLSRDIGLETHVTDVVNRIEYEDLEDVVLVGHSYGGMVVGSVQSRVPERIRTLVYLDAFVPVDGKSMFNFQIERAREELTDSANSDGEGWYVPALDPRGKVLDISDPDEVAWLARHITPHPLKPFTDLASVKNEAAASVRKAYVYCTNKPHGSSFAQFAEIAKRDPDWFYFEMDTHHDPMVSQPGELANILLGIAKSGL